MRHITLRKSTYRDSVSLMRISKLANGLDGVNFVMVAMATDTNLDLLKDAGFEAAELRGAEPNDLLIALELETDSILDDVIGRIDEEIHGGTATAGEESGEATVSFDASLKTYPDINLVLISVPGRFAAFEARKALEAGKHVMIFSDNVTAEDEKRLKDYAGERGLLVMGPDCGTAVINGVGLGFANQVPRGEIGMVAASGTGAQEVSSILARSYQVGISQMIGTGGRDVSRQIGGVMLKMGLRALIDDAATRAIVIVSKHPDREIAEEVIGAAREGGKPCIIHFTGQKTSGGDKAGHDRSGTDTSLMFTRTLAETAAEAARAAGVKPEAATGYRQDVKAALLEAAAKLPPGRKYIRGLFSGGTLAQEAVFLLSDKVGDIHTNLKIEGFPRLKDPGESEGHTIVDLGDDTFTRGRAHPMIDQAYRLIRLENEMKDPEAAIILLDVVLGYGCHEAPGAEIATALARIRGGADDGPLVIASICGTYGDPQNYAGERKALESAGVFVAEHNQGLCDLALAALKAGQDAKRVG
ncbi:MAG: acyl-CoA synthetase FdrA [bacterium]|jgi:succinyl-CoA synthetase alpha subunit